MGSINKNKLLKIGPLVSFVFSLGRRDSDRVIVSSIIIRCIHYRAVKSCRALHSSLSKRFTVPGSQSRGRSVPARCQTLHPGQPVLPRQAKVSPSWAWASAVMMTLPPILCHCDSSHGPG